MKKKKTNNTALQETRKAPIPCATIHESTYYALKHGGKKGRNHRKTELKAIRNEMEG